jgi:hypothetical protein
MAANDEGTVFGKTAVEQLARAVRDNEHRMMLPRGHRGRWQFHGGSGGTHEIWFTIISVECVSATEMILTVNPTWYTGGCTASIPGEDSYGYVEVEDVCSILSFYTAEWLDGSLDGIPKTGRATYMYPRTGDCIPKWLVDTICGTPECA